MKKIDSYLTGEGRKEERKSEGRRGERDAEKKNKRVFDAERYFKVVGGHGTKEKSWGSFVFLPKRTKSSILLDNEVIVLLVRKHIITLLGSVILILGAIFLPFLMMQWSGWQSLNPAFIFLIWVSWYLVVFGMSLMVYIVWFYNVYILTDERVIDMNFPNILYSDISITTTLAIADHSLKSSGFLEVALDYGTVDIQTAGEQKEFAFEKIPHPEEVNRLLGELILEEKEEEMEGRVR